jgi:uncharacterized protein YjbI with pentapeptide repeats
MRTDELLVSIANNDMESVPDGLLNTISSGDIRRRKLSGRVAPRQSFHGNFVECRFDDVEFDEIDLSRCDWKDCRLRNATFRDCNLGHASFLTNSFESCRFVRCRFPDTSVSDSTFLHCSFDLCDFSHIIVKASRFQATNFSKCKTSNRVIESSLLLATHWSDMELEWAIVLGNFGLRRSDLENCRFVNKSGEQATSGDPGAGSIAASSDLSAIEAFRLSYFTHEAVDGEPTVLEAVLDLRSWGGEAYVQASFAAQLSGFAQFLLSRFDSGEMPLYPLLLLHSSNFAFLEWLSGIEASTALYQTVAGVHLTLTREVDAFAALMSAFVEASKGSGTIHFAAEGPVDVAHFQTWLNHQGIDGISVGSVRPRNSPVDLALIWQDHSALIALIGLFLATRTKIELVRLRERASLDKAERHSEDDAGQPLLTFSTGFSGVRPAEYEINVRTILPRSLLLDLKLNFSVAIFRRVRLVLLDLLSSSHPPNAGGSPPALPREAGRSARRSHRE